jgi:hypothetical protein
LLKARADGGTCVRTPCDATRPSEPDARAEPHDPGGGPRRRRATDRRRRRQHRHDSETADSRADSTYPEAEPPRTLDPHDAQPRPAPPQHLPFLLHPALSPRRPYGHPNPGFLHLHLRTLLPRSRCRRPASGPQAHRLGHQQVYLESRGRGVRREAADPPSSQAQAQSEIGAGGGAAACCPPRINTQRSTPRDQQPPARPNTCQAPGWQPANGALRGRR